MGLDVIVLDDFESEWLGFVMKCPLCETMWMMDVDTFLNYCPHKILTPLTTLCTSVRREFNDYYYC